MAQRIGIGYDIHRMVEGRKLIIGGVEIPFIKGLLGHSDADVLLHAVIDALLGAAAQPDIGEQFPDTDPQYQDSASTVLLAKVVALLKANGFTVENIDAVIVAEEPVMAPFKQHMRQNLSSLIGIPLQTVSVKAKTNEGVGDIGKGEAIAVYATALLSKGV